MPAAAFVRALPGVAPAAAAGEGPAKRGIGSWMARVQTAVLGGTEDGRAPERAARELLAEFPPERWALSDGRVFCTQGIWDELRGRADDVRQRAATRISAVARGR